MRSPIRLLTVLLGAFTVFAIAWVGASASDPSTPGALSAARPDGEAQARWQSAAGRRRGRKLLPRHVVLILGDPSGNLLAYCPGRLPVVR